MYFNFMSKNDFLYYECLLSAVFTSFIFIFLKYKNEKIEMVPILLSLLLMISSIMFL
jgi:hypothetical protein